MNQHRSIWFAFGKMRFAIIVLATGSASIFNDQSGAQTFTTLHSFAPPEYGHPQATLVLSNNTLYGTATFGAGARNGAVFSLKTDGTSFSVLYAFTGGTDGSFPYGSLVLANGTLYGTTRLGGDNYNGNVFSINADFIGFTLQSTRNLGPSAIWATNLPARVVVNGQNTVTNPISGTQQFYRLVQ